MLKPERVGDLLESKLEAPDFPLLPLILLSASLISVSSCLELGWIGWIPETHR